MAINVFGVILGTKLAAERMVRRMTASALKAGAPGRAATVPVALPQTA